MLPQDDECMYCVYCGNVIQPGKSCYILDESDHPEKVAYSDVGELFDSTDCALAYIVEMGY